MIIKINYNVNDLWRELEKKNSLIKQFIELDNMFFSFFGCHRSTDESVSLAHYPQKMAFLQQKFVKKIDLPSGGLRRRCPPRFGFARLCRDNWRIFRWQRVQISIHREHRRC